MVSSVAPGKVPHTSEVFRFGTISTSSVAFTRALWPAGSDAIKSRTARPSSLPTVNAGALVLLGYAW